MAVVTEDQIGEDIAATVRAISGIVSCAYPPPENAPVQGPATWVDLGPIEVQQGSLEVSYITITITVATPRKGNYPDEYRLVLSYARKVQIAFRANVAVAGEAIVMAPATIGKPAAGRYGEVNPHIVFCVVTLIVETMTETVNQIAL